mgnify:CR=1 FL=1
MSSGIWEPEIRPVAEIVKASGWFGLVLGDSGSGKTTLLRTVPCITRTLALNIEGGFRSVADLPLNAMDVKSSSEFEHLLDWLETRGLGKFDLLFVDSLTELAEMVLREQPEDPKYKLTKYDTLKSKLLQYAARMRSLPISVICTAGVRRNVDTGLLETLMPGTKLPSQIPYSFDFVAAMRCEENADGDLTRGLQFAPKDPYSFCKIRDPHGVIQRFEHPDLAAIIEKLETAENKARNANAESNSNGSS